MSEAELVLPRERRSGKQKIKCGKPLGASPSSAGSRRYRLRETKVFTLDIKGAEKVKTLEKEKMGVRVPDTISPSAEQTIRSVSQAVCVIRASSTRTTRIFSLRTCALLMKVTMKGENMGTDEESHYST